MNDQPPAPNGDLDPRAPREIAFPGNELALAVAIGLPALLIAAACTLALISYLGPQFDVVIMNDHVIGGTSDQLFLIFIGSVLGAIGVFCALRFWHRLGDWRRDRRDPDTGVVPR
jgi:hypothetical protein